MRLRPLMSPSYVLAAAVLMLSACGPKATSVAEPATPEVSATGSSQPTSVVESSPSPTPAWQTYRNSSFGINLEFPTSWYGPDVYEVDNQLRLAVGSDVVFPYGTPPETLQAPKENSYQIVIQYTLNRENWTLEQYREAQPWFDDYLSLLGLKDGESSSTQRSLTTRIRELKVGGFTGAEFLNTPSETAQTEAFYIRSAFLYDAHLNVLLITGSPNNVVVSDPAHGRDAFQAIDEANLQTFHHILDALRVE